MAQWISGTRKLNNHYQSGGRKTYYWLVDYDNIHEEGDNVIIDNNTSYIDSLLFERLTTSPVTRIFPYIRLIGKKGNIEIKPVLRDSNGGFIHNFTLELGYKNLGVLYQPYHAQAWELEKDLWNRITLNAPQITAIHENLYPNQSYQAPTMGVYFHNFQYGQNEAIYMLDTPPTPKIIINRNATVATNPSILTADSEGQPTTATTEIQNILAKTSIQGFYGFMPIIKPVIEKTGVIQ